MKIKKILGTIALAGALSFNKANAQTISGDIGYVMSEKHNNSYVESDVFYNLPGGVKGFTLLDLYDENGYFGKTTLTRPNKTGISPRLQVVHPNEFYGGLGLGIEATIDTPSFLDSAKLRVIPLWLDDKGGYDKNKAVIGYAISKKLPYGLNLFAHGEANLSSKKGPSWMYGEAELSKRVGPVSLGYSAALNNQREGKLTPSLEHRLTARVNF